MAARSWAQFRDPDRLVSCLWKTSWEEHKAKAEEASHLQAPPESPLHPSVKPARLLVSVGLDAQTRTGCGLLAGIPPPVPVVL